MLKCEVCLTEGHYKVRCESGVWMCSDCLSKRYVSKESAGYVKDTMWIDGYGSTSVARIKEMESRVILPNVDSRDPQHYFVGSKRGSKVYEREPNIYKD